MNAITKYAFTTSTAVLLVLGMLQAWAEPIAYEGTASLCYQGALSPSVEQKGNASPTYVSYVVSLYYIQTAPVNADTAPAGLVNGWGLLISDMKITRAVYWLDWIAVLYPTDYEHDPTTVLEETASVKTKDLSTLSGTWQGTGELEGTVVDYVLIVDADAEPDCPNGVYPPPCDLIEGGCMEAQETLVYDMSGFVN